MEKDARPAIFVFTTAYYPLIGGAEIAIQEIAKRLKNEFRFFVITARMSPSLSKRESRPESTVIRVGFGSKFDKWLMPVLAIPYFSREIRNQGIAPSRVILWGMDISAGALGASFLKIIFPRLPFVFSIQYGYGEERLRRGRFGMIRRAFVFMLRRADSVTAISSYLADAARQFGYQKKVELLPNGVDLKQFSARKKEPRSLPPTVITVSRLVQKNGVDILIRAVAEVKKFLPDIRCRIIGDGPERKSLERLAKSLGLERACGFYGGVPYEELPGHLAGANVFARPSRSEGMGNAFIEALAAGLPVIGTPVGGITDIIRDGETGLFCRVEDPADLASKIIALLTNPSLVSSIVSNGRKMVEERFSWGRIASAFGELFRRSFPPLHILIASPMFPPDIGGPGGYAKNLAEHMSAKGCKVSVLSYGQNLTRLNLVSIVKVSHAWVSGFKHIVYLFKAWRMLGQSDVAVALDPVIVGGPVAVACWLRRKPLVIRVEGDFLWEWYSERIGQEIILREFYEKFGARRLSVKERLMYKIARWVFSQSRRIVFSSQWRKAMFELGYPLRSEQAAIIDSPWPKVGAGGSDRNRILVFAGRFVRVKNLLRLIRAFLAADAEKKWRLELIGEGPQKQEIEKIIRESGTGGRITITPPMPHSELMEKISSAYAFLLPSLSDVSPNVILDCLATATPFLLTRETGFYETLKDIGLFADPRDETGIASKIRELLDSGFYAAYRERLKQFCKVRSWDEVASDWLLLVRAVLSNKDRKSP